MRIGEIAKKSDIPASTIRFYEKEGLLPDAHRSSSGYRIYNNDILEYIQFIKVGQMLGFKLHELPALMRNGTSPDHDALLQILGNKKAELDARIAVLKDKSEKIDKLKQELATTWDTGNCMCSKRLAELFDSEPNTEPSSEIPPK